MTTKRRPRSRYRDRRRSVTEFIRIQNADGTLLATPDEPGEDLVPSLHALSDVMCTGDQVAAAP